MAESLLSQLDNLNLIESSNSPSNGKLKMQSAVENEDKDIDKENKEVESIKKKNKKRKRRESIMKNKKENGDNSIVKNEFIYTNVWESLHEVYQVAKDIKRSFKPNNINQQMSYEDLVDYILDVFTSTKKNFSLKSPAQIEATKYCSCFYKQRAFCCPALCSEEQFTLMMSQPIYTSYRNHKHCIEHGSFELSSLSDSIRDLPSPDKSKNNVAKDSRKSDSKKTSNLLNIEDIKKIAEERDNANDQLKAAYEKIARLNSRVQFFELELRNAIHKRC